MPHILQTYVRGDGIFSQEKMLLNIEKTHEKNS